MNLGNPVFEITLFWNEHSIFRERIQNTLQYADYFFIAEGNESHSGKIKRDFKLPELLRSLPSDQQKRVIFVPVDLSLTEEKNPFERERIVRDAALQAAIWAPEFSSEALLIIQDFDEFLNPTKIEALKKELYSWRFWKRAIRIRQRLSYFKLNLMDQDDWTLALACKGSLALEAGFSANRWRHQVAKKKARVTSHHLGWHHSYLGDVGFIRNKVESFAEANIQMVKNLSDLDIANAIQNGTDLYGRKTSYTKISYSQNDPIPVLLERFDLMVKE